MEYRPQTTSGLVSSGMSNQNRCQQEISSKKHRNPDGAESVPELQGVLNVYVHHARDIHNICIYSKQDVYAKFYLTTDPDNVLSTRIAKGGGRNPVFDEELKLRVRGQLEDTSLKCQIWMLSCDKSYMGDQVLGSASVPLSSVVGKGELTKDFALCTTELFHSPAGILKLTLSFSGSELPDVLVIENPPMPLSPISSEPPASKFNDIEFPDLDVDRENKRMASEYIQISSFDSNAQNKPKGELVSGDKAEKEQASQNGLKGELLPAGVTQNGRCATSNLKMSAESVDKVNDGPGYVSDKNGSKIAEVGSDAEHSSSCTNGGDTVITSLSKGNTSVEHPEKDASMERSSNSNSMQEKSSSEDSKEQTSTMSVMSTTEEGSSTLKTPLVKIDIQPDQPVLQEQIVDMYMKSMQQFTESLAKMKLPMDKDKQDSGSSSNSGSEKENGQPPKTVGSKVYYGSRAFF
eukprot:TRINITY_DN47_c0_g2_i1.p1 TRINITY_DN47_c0_g2~~TRINITY_DN47_c0_g2_i1.p1  ORF type:complete len:462 (-),score=83.14 TRINITY_DN47_c0_g2_i1:543-1928(-)